MSVRLVVQELIQNLNGDLAIKFPSTTDLSALFAHIEEQKDIVKRNFDRIARLNFTYRSTFAERDGKLWLHRRLHGENIDGLQQVFILLENFNNIGPDDVRTLPIRTYHQAIHTLNRGIDFIEAILKDPLLYININE